MVVSSDFARQNGPGASSTSATAPHQSSNGGSGDIHTGGHGSDTHGGPPSEFEIRDSRTGHDRNSSNNPPQSPSLDNALSAIDRAIAASLGSGLTTAEEDLRVCGLVEATGLPPAVAREALQMNEWSIARAANHYIPEMLYISPEQQRRQAAAAAAEARARIAAEEKQAVDELKRQTEVRAAEKGARAEEARRTHANEVAALQEELARARLAAEEEKRQWALEEAAAEELAASENAALEAAATQAIAAVELAQNPYSSSHAQQQRGAQERDEAVVSSEVVAADAAALSMERRQREIEARRAQQEAAAAAAALKDEEARALQAQHLARLRIAVWIRKRWLKRQFTKAAAAAAAEAARIRALEEEAAAEAARVKALEEEAAAEAARFKALEKEAAIEAARIKALEEEAAAEAARVKALEEEAAAEAARVKALEEEAAAEAARVKEIEEEAATEAARVKAVAEEAVAIAVAEAAAVEAACTLQRLAKRRHACSLVAQRRLASHAVGAAARRALARRQCAALRWAKEQERADEESAQSHEGVSTAEAAAEASNRDEKEREPEPDLVGCGGALRTSSAGNDAHMSASAVEEAIGAAPSGGGTSTTEEDERLREESKCAMEAERKRNYDMPCINATTMLHEFIRYQTNTSTEIAAPAPPRSMPPAESQEEARLLLEAAAAHRARADAQAAARKQQESSAQGSSSSSSKWSRAQVLAKAELERQRTQHSGFGAAGERKKPAAARKVVNGVEYERVGGGWAPLHASSGLWQPRDALRMEKRRQQEEVEALKLSGHKDPLQLLPLPISQSHSKGNNSTCGPPRIQGHGGSVKNMISGSQSLRRHSDTKPNHSGEGASTTSVYRSVTPPVNAACAASATARSAAADSGYSASVTQGFLPPLGLPPGRVPIKAKTRECT